MSSLFIQSLFERATKTTTTTTTTNTNTTSYNNNKDDTLELYDGSKYQETIDSLNDEISQLEKEIELLEQNQIENQEDLEFKEIKTLLNNYIFNKYNKNDKIIEDGEQEEHQEEEQQEEQEEEEDLKIIKNNILLKNLTGYNIEHSLNEIILDNDNNQILNYMYRGDCNGIQFNIEFKVKQDQQQDQEQDQQQPFIEKLIIKVPLLFQLNFRNILNHCQNTKSLGLLLKSFQRITKTCLKRNQFFNLLLNEFRNDVNSGNSSNNNNGDNYYKNEIISIPGGYYSNSFIYHPKYLEPIFYLYWDIKFDQVYERVNNNIHVIADPKLYSKQIIDKIQDILQQLSIYNNLSKNNLNNLINFIKFPLSKIMKSK